MQRNDLGTINPTDLTADQETVLMSYLLEHAECTYLERFKPYETTIGADTDNPITYRFSLTNNLLRRPSKKEDGVRIEVIDHDKRLGKGGFGEVLKSVGVLIPKNNHHFLFKAKSRAIKHQIHKTEDEIFTSSVNSVNKSLPEYATNEYEITAKTSHIHAKPPVFVEPDNDSINSYMAMRILGTLNLHELITDENNRRRLISTSHRLDLTINILKAVADQVHDHDLVHRDLKPENVMLDPKTSEVFIIDFHSAKILENRSHRPPLSGTPIFQPIEQFDPSYNEGEKYSKKTDSYSIGKTLAEFWHAKFDIGRNYKDAMRLALSDTKFDFGEFKHGELERAQSDTIQTTLLGLTKSKPGDRLDINHAIQKLEAVRLEYTLKQLRNDHDKEITNKAFDIAQQIKHSWLRGSKKTSTIKRLIKKHLDDGIDSTKPAFELFKKVLGIGHFYDCQSMQEILDCIVQQEKDLTNYQVHAERLRAIYRTNYNEEGSNLPRNDELRIDTLEKLIVRARGFYGDFNTLVNLNNKFKKAMFGYTPSDSDERSSDIHSIIPKLAEGVKLRRSHSHIKPVDRLKLIIKFEVLDYLSHLRTGNPSHSQATLLEAILDLTNKYHQSGTKLAEEIKLLPSKKELKISFLYHCSQLKDRIFEKIDSFLTDNNSPEISIHSTHTNSQTNSPSRI